ncbi:MAG: hypothetical protein RQ751_10675 [Longimicrobiales bacterium]|nr:hypothetical protein [Longimicrobiales bacterium]
MTESHRPSDPTSSDPEEQAMLRAKYHDYCSAQVADILLRLPPDEMYVVAEKAARERGDAPARSWEEMVRGATAWLSARIPLPPFEAWVADYRAHPERYEAYLMGLWRSRGDGEAD